MTPRPYQFEAIDSLFEYWAEHTGNPVICQPTGTGKSIVIAGFCTKALARFPFTRILVLTHVKELIQQNFEKLLTIWPSAPAGVYSAGLKRRDTGKNIIFGGIGSVCNNEHLFGHVDLIIIDECHTVSPKAETQYRQTIERLKAINPALKVGGLTATAYRLGMGEIIEEGGIFTDICCDQTSLERFNEFFDEGYLCPLIPRATSVELDTSGVKVTAGDFNRKQLTAAVDKESITRAAVAEMIASGHDRKSWLVFAAGIEHTEHVAEILRESGIDAVAVHSKSGDAFRDEATLAFKAGEVQALVNNGVFTTGFDHPGLDLISILRPTQSPGLWVQMLGRGTRTDYAPGFDLSTKEGRLASIAASDKQNCLVLDFAGNTKRLGPINDPRKPKRRGKGKKGDMPAKLCECGTFNFCAARICIGCGKAFEQRVNFTAHAAGDALIAKLGKPAKPVDVPQLEWFTVESTTYSKHIPWNRRPTLRGLKPANMRVTYNCGLRSFSEHIHLENPGSKTYSEQWWRESCLDDTPCPDTVDAACAHSPNLREVGRIKVHVNLKRPNILHREFKDE